MGYSGTAFDTQGAAAACNIISSGDAAANYCPRDAERPHQAECERSPARDTATSCGPPFLLFLSKFYQSQEAGETAQALQALLGLLWKFELTGNYRIYRAASILMADLSLEMSLECKSLTILRDLMPQGVFLVVTEDEPDLCGT
jgi:hypothetical protein